MSLSASPVLIGYGRLETLPIALQLFDRFDVFLNCFSIPPDGDYQAPPQPGIAEQVDGLLLDSKHLIAAVPSMQRPRWSRARYLARDRFGSLPK
jgi:hypothetical protein